jgi:outer membrane protein TolC
LWWAPSLDAYAGKYLYTLRERDYLAARLRDDVAVGGKFSLRIFDGGAERAEARARRLEASGTERKLLQRQTDLRARVRIVEEDLKHDHELVHFAEERIAMAGRYLHSTLDEYDRGVKNSLDVFAAAQRLLGYRRQLAERRRDYQITKVGLMQEHGL